MKSYNGGEQVNIFNAGMNLDLDISLISEGVYLYGQNVRVVCDTHGTSGVVQAMQGAAPMIGQQLPQAETIIGVATIRDRAVIFTRVSGQTNSIYRMTLTSETGYTLKKLTTQDFNIGGGVDRQMSIVCAWEDVDNIKVYWADGIHQLRSINIYDGSDLVNSTASIGTFDAYPSVEFSAPEFINFGSGALKAGLYQYAYQFYVKNGGETVVSPLSRLIHTTRSINTDNDFVGTSADAPEGSSKSIRMSIAISDSGFEQIRIYALYYKALNDTPEVRIVAESPISGSLFTFEDRGQLATETTWEEFSGKSSTLFIPRIIESRRDRLFAANLVEDTWDLSGSADIEGDGYDTRAFSFNSRGECLLFEDGFAITPNTYQHKFKAGGLQICGTRPCLFDDDDCINPANALINKQAKDLVEDGFDCFYDKDGFRGGTGPNVSFRTIYSPIGESWISTSTDATQPSMGWITGRTKLLNTWPKPEGAYSEIDSLPYWYKVPNSPTETSNGLIKYKNSESEDRCINYANEKIDANFRGYQRDSLYRFGVVFYDEKGRTTPVSWIADYRMPDMTDKDSRLFDQNKKIKISSNHYATFEVVLYALGLEFKFENLPDNIKALEIVRSPREVMDRNIIAQGVLSKTTSDALSINNYRTSFRAFAHLGLGRYVSYRNGESSSNNHIWFPGTNEPDGQAEDSQRAADLYGDEYIGERHPLLFASPEISVSQDKFEERLKSANAIIPLYGLLSPHEENSGSGVVPAIGSALASSGSEFRSSRNGQLVSAGARQIHMVTLPYANSNCCAQLISKYFNPFNNETGTASDKFLFNNKLSISDSIIATNIEPTAKAEALTSFYDSVGGFSYNNWSMNENIFRESSKIPENSRNIKNGPHGVCAVISLVDAATREMPFYKATIRIGSVNYFGDRNCPRLGSWPEQSSGDMLSMSYVVLANITQPASPYNGLGINSRKTSTYVSTGAYVIPENGGGSFVVYGGDTYVGVHDYAVTYSFDTAEGERMGESSYLGAYFPCESSINMSLMHGTNYHNGANTGRPQYFIQLNPFKDRYGATQSEAMYGYNTGYSSNSIGRSFLPKSINSENDKGWDYRVCYSDAKQMDEISDSWLKFQPGNCLDVDTRFGSINRMVSFGDRLYFWQDDAFGVFSIEDRSLIADGNIGKLVVGTGDILKQYNYITTSNGSKKNMLNNIAKTDRSLIWYDHDRAEIVSFDQSIGKVSKTLGVQSHLNERKSKVQDHMITSYDSKYNDVYFKFNYTDQSVDNNLVYNLQLGKFTTFTTLSSDWFLPFGGKSVSIKNNKAYLHNAGAPNKFYKDTPDRTIVEYAVAKDLTKTKVFDNVEFDGDLESKNVSDLSFSFSTKTQTSQPVVRGSVDERADIYYKENTYKFAMPRNNADKIGRMRGKYLISYINMTPTSSNFTLSYVKTIYRISNI